MRILQVMRAPVGGLFRHVVDLTVELAARGHEIGVVADSRANDARTESRLDALGAHARLGVYRFPIPRVLGPHDLVTPWRIRKLARELDVAILHGHGAKGGFGARLAKLGLKECKALYTPHGGALHFDRSRPSGALFMAIERGLLSLTDALVFESDHASKIFAEKIKQPPCPNRVIHNGLAQAEFEPVAPGPADFVFVGELRLLKGIDVLLAALAPLVRPDGQPATLIMAGDGPDAREVRSMIAELGLGARVELIGVTPAREAFSKGQCVVVPSRAESLPYVVLEAAAAKCPVIATNVGGIPEIFGPDADRLVPADDVEALGAAMAGYLAASDSHRAHAAAHQQFIARNFSITHMTDRIEALYRELIEGRA